MNIRRAITFATPLAALLAATVHGQVGRGSTE